MARKFTLKKRNRISLLSSDVILFLCAKVFFCIFVFAQNLLFSILVRLQLSPNQIYADLLSLNSVAVFTLIGNPLSKATDKIKPAKILSIANHWSLVRIQFVRLHIKIGFIDGSRVWVP